MPSNPCSNCRRTDQGKLRYWYLNGYEGDRSFKYRLRLCQNCQLELVADLINLADVEGARGTWLTREEAQ